MGLHGMRCLLIFSGGEDYAGLDRFPVRCCVIGERIVRGSGARVNGSRCAWFRKTVQKFFVWIEAPKKGTAHYFLDPTWGNKKKEITQRR
jgi:hypothetical protein